MIRTAGLTLGSVSHLADAMAPLCCCYQDLTVPEAHKMGAHLAALIFDAVSLLITHHNCFFLWFITFPTDLIRIDLHELERHYARFPKNPQGRVAAREDWNFRKSVRISHDRSLPDTMSRLRRELRLLKEKAKWNTAAWKEAQQGGAEGVNATGESTSKAEGEIAEDAKAKTVATAKAKSVQKATGSKAKQASQK